MRTTCGRKTRIRRLAIYGWMVHVGFPAFAAKDPGGYIAWGEGKLTEFEKGRGSRRQIPSGKSGSFL